MKEGFLLIAGVALAVVVASNLYSKEKRTGITYYLNGRKVFAPYGVNGKPDYTQIRPVN